MDLTLPRSLLTSRGGGAMAEATHRSRRWPVAHSHAGRHGAAPPEGVMGGTRARHRVLLEL